MVSDWEEMSQLLAYGGGARTVAATNANDCSSRSHAVFMIAFRQVPLSVWSKATVVGGVGKSIFKTLSLMDLLFRG